MKTSALRLRTVNVMSKSGAYEVDPTSNDQYRQNWQVVEYTVAQLAADSTWPATTDPAICSRCEFNTVCDSAVKNPDDFDA
jgi:hypothetical protein